MFFGGSLVVPYRMTNLYQIVWDFSGVSPECLASLEPLGEMQTMTADHCGS